MPTLTLEDVKISLHDITGVFSLMSIIMLLPVTATLYYSRFSGVFSLIKAVSVFVVPSLIFHLMYKYLKGLKVGRRHGQTKHALVGVVVIWMIIAIVGALPFYLRGTLGVVDSFFESMSGWATTGMTMIEYPESLMGGNEDILLYRSITHIVGGVGIIALGLMVLIKSGTAAMAYYSSEVGSQRIKPGIKSTVIETWKIYILYALAGVVLLYLAGMGPFDAINHAFAAIATGGFSTHSESVAYFDSVLIEAVLILLMLAGSISFLVHYELFNGEFKKVFKNIELKYMAFLIGASTLILVVYFSASVGIAGVDINSFFDVVRKSFFQVVSSISCTGFSTTNAGEWPPLAQTILMILMYTGGFYGSTAGGIKLLRLAVVVAAINHTLKRLILPKSAVVSMKVAGKNISNTEIAQTLGLSMAYLIVAVIGAMAIMSIGDYTGYESMELSLSAMGNVGIVYTTGARWYLMPAVGKITIALLMWIGRLEIFPILIILKPLFDRRKK